MSAATPAGHLIDLALSRPQVWPTGRLLCIDGLAGAGKSTLAAEVATTAEARGLGVRVVHTDDLLHGWEGLPGLGEDVERLVVGPLRAGRPGRYRRYDWVAEAFAEEVAVAPTDLVVLEGVGSADPRYAADITVIAWVEAPMQTRLARGLARDGDALRAQWLRWLDDEREHHRTRRTRERAEVRLRT